MRRILVPCDFSTPAQQAYKFALDLAAKSEGEVYVLKVIELPMLYETTFGIQPYVFDPKLLTDLEEDAQAKFAKMKKQYPAKVPVNFQALQGPVTPTIRESIESDNIDTIVMGTHGSSGLEEFFIGSNTERIVRTSPVPVFAVRDACDIASIKSIVFPTVPDLEQFNLVMKVKELQSFFDATVHLLFINTPSNFVRDSDARTALEEFAAFFKLTNYTVNVHSDTSEPNGIISFVKSIQADMIAMGTHGHRGLAHLLAGSIAEDVVNHAATCPIWTYSLKGK